MNAYPIYQSTSRRASRAATSRPVANCSSRFGEGKHKPDALDKLLGL